MNVSAAANAPGSESSGGSTDLCLDHWPVVVVTPAEGAISDEELDAFMTRFDVEVRPRGESFVTVLDLTKNSGITARQRKYMSERIRSNSERGDMNVATGFVFSSRMMRGLLTAILWMRSPEYPTETFATIEEAVQWGNGLLGRDATSPSGERPLHDAAANDGERPRTASAPPGSTAPQGAASASTAPTTSDHLPAMLPATTTSKPPGHAVDSPSTRPPLEVSGTLPTRRVATPSTRPGESAHPSQTPDRPVAPSNLAAELRAKFPATPSTPPTAPPAAVRGALTSVEAEEKLRTLQRLFDRGLISQQELAERRRSVLDRL